MRAGVRWSDVVSRRKLRPAYTQVARSVGGSSHGCAPVCFGEFRLCYSATRRVRVECALIGCRILPTLSEKTPHFIQDARVLKTVVRLNKNNAGVYGTVVQTGTIRVGDPVSLVLDARR